MSRFEHLHVRGFRRLYDLKLVLRPLCVLVGANGSGKTSLLDVFALLAASASGKLSDKISELEGMSAILTIDRVPELSFELAMSALSPHKRLVYDLTLSATAIAYEIAEEMLTQQRSGKPAPFKHIQSQHGDIRYFEANRGLVRPTWEHKPLETSLAQVPKMFQEPEDFRNRLASSTHYHVLNVEPRAPVRLPQPLRPASWADQLDLDEWLKEYSLDEVWRLGRMGGRA